MKKLVSILISWIIVVSSLSCGLTALADDNTNLMLSATLSANNAYYNGWYPTNRPLSKLNDGNTYVGVGYNGGNLATIPMEADGTGYVNAAFGTATTLNKVIIYFAGTSAGVAAENVTRDFAVDVKLENGLWQRVAEQHLDAWTNWDAKKVTLCFDAVNVTDICLKIKNHASSAIYEIEAFYDSTLTSANNTPIVSNDYTVDAIPMPACVNLLPTTSVSANAEHYNGWYDIERPISKLIDGEKHISYNAGKLMVTPYGANGQACINFAFDKASYVNKVVVYLPGTSNGVATTNQVTDYTIDAQLADGRWMRVAEKHAEPYDKWDYYSHEFYFDAVKCVNLRLTSVNAKGQTSASFLEIEAYNINTQTSESNTPIVSNDYTVDAIPMPACVNLLPTTSVSANAEHYNGWYDIERPISKLIDGEKHISYNAGKLMITPYGTNGQACINFAFDRATYVNKVVVYLPGTSNGVGITNQVTDYAIDALLEDGNWVRVAEKHAEPYDKWDYYSHEFYFDAVKCTNLRLTTVNAKGQTSAGFLEIEAYNINTQTSESNTPKDSSDYKENSIPMPVYTNLLPETTVTANAEHYNGWYEYERPISRLIDGEKEISYDASKLMVTPYGSNGQACINFAFDKATYVNKVVVYLPGTSNEVATTNQVTDYAIDVLLEDGRWVRVAEKHAESYDKWDYYTHEFYFDVVKCTNLRLIAVNADGQTSASFLEIEAYNINTQTSANNTPIDCKDYTEKAIPNIVTNNLATNASLTANAEHYNGWYNYERPISSLTDGKTFVGEGYNIGKTFVSPYDANGYAYANLKFSKPTTINKIVVYFPGYNAVEVKNQIREYAVDVRDEDGVWTRVAKQNNAERSHWDAYSDTLIFDAVECVQVRITCVNSFGQSSMGIYEIEAYNVNTLTKADNTALEDGSNINIPTSVDWAEDVAEPQDYAYSFALVGDTQIVTKNDALNGTNDLANMYQYIIDKKDEYKIAQVIGLGDIVDTYADGEQKENEWKIATSAISKLDGVLPYTLVSGNHDINWNFNYRIASGLPNYINQSQVVSKWGKVEAGETTDEPSVANTAHEFTVNGVDYLIVTIEYAAHSTNGVIDWANKVIKNHPHHNVIITTHAYLSDNGDILDGTNNGSPSSYSGCADHNDGDYFWDNLVSKHENISMVICGHVGTENIVKSTKIGDKGNTVTQIMVNTQDLDADIGSTGTVAFLYFSEDGKNVQVRQYSTARERYLGSNSQTTFTVNTARAAVNGDINNDAKVDLRDLVAFKKYFVDKENYWIDPYTSDLDGNKVFDTIDLSKLRMLLLGK